MISASTHLSASGHIHVYSLAETAWGESASLLILLLEAQTVIAQVLCRLRGEPLLLIIPASVHVRVKDETGTTLIPYWIRLGMHVRALAARLTLLRNGIHAGSLARPILVDIQKS